MDRTHIRWFTRLTMVDLFESTGFKVVNMFSRSCMKETPITEKIFANIAIIAEALGLDPEVAQKDSIPVQWIIKAIPV